MEKPWPLDQMSGLTHWVTWHAGKLEFSPSVKTHLSFPLHLLSTGSNWAQVCAHIVLQSPFRCLTRACATPNRTLQTASIQPISLFCNLPSYNTPPFPQFHPDISISSPTPHHSSTITHISGAQLALQLRVNTTGGTLSPQLPLHWPSELSPLSYPGCFCCSPLSPYKKCMPPPPLPNLCSFSTLFHIFLHQLLHLYQE